jgi:hypothetical protein
LTERERTYPNRSHVISGWIFTAGRQGAGAPIIDGCRIEIEDGRHAGGICIRWSPQPGRGLIIGRVGKPSPNPQRWRALPTRLTAMRGHLA